MSSSQFVDVNSDLSYLNSREYLCYLRTEEVQERLHAGSRQYQDTTNYQFLDNTIAFNTQERLERLLSSQRVRFVLHMSSLPVDEVLRVVVLSGNMNMAIHTLGLNKVIRSLHWSQARQFRETPSRLLYSDKRIGGHYSHFGSLRYITIRDAGHFISISQPRATRIFKMFCQDTFESCTKIQ